MVPACFNLDELFFTISYLSRGLSKVGISHGLQPLHDWFRIHEHVANHVGLQGVGGGLDAIAFIVVPGLKDDYRGYEGIYIWARSELEHA